MTNLNILYATLVLALLLSEQQQMSVAKAAYHSGQKKSSGSKDMENNYDDSNESSNSGSASGSGSGSSIKEPHKNLNKLRQNAHHQLRHQHYHQQQPHGEHELHHHTTDYSSHHHHHMIAPTNQRYVNAAQENQQHFSHKQHVDKKQHINKQDPVSERTLNEYNTMTSVSYIQLFHASTTDAAPANDNTDDYYADLDEHDDDEVNNSNNDSRSSSEQVNKSKNHLNSNTDDEVANDEDDNDEDDNDEDSDYEDENEGGVNEPFPNIMIANEAKNERLNYQQHLYEHHHHHHMNDLKMMPTKKMLQRATGHNRDYARVTREHHDQHATPNNHLQDEYASDEPFRNSRTDQFPTEMRPGVLTERKYRELGTLDAVQQSREKYVEQNNKARSHLNDMAFATQCSRPLPRVISVSRETSKIYDPHCTILYRCGEDTGCCGTTRQVCAVKTYVEVPLYFFVARWTGSAYVTSPNAEVLVFRNHTACHCVNLTSNMLRDKRSGHSPEISEEYNSFQQEQQTYQTETRQKPLRRNTAHFSNRYDNHNMEQKSGDYATQTSATPLNSVCRCPRHFDVSFEANWDALVAIDAARVHRNSTKTTHGLKNCMCNCLNRESPCQRLKNGEEGFAVEDRKCISDNLCKPPVCAYGEYNRQAGRCPRVGSSRTVSKRYDGFG